jgi:predicted XRE-type DNA-binding protein
LSRLGWPQEKISETVGINQQRISQITNNANFTNIGNLLAQGRDMENQKQSPVWPS